MVGDLSSYSGGTQKHTRPFISILEMNSKHSRNSIHYKNYIRKLQEANLNLKHTNKLFWAKTKSTERIEDTIWYVTQI